jgi:hypothetical protein
LNEPKIDATRLVTISFVALVFVAEPIYKLRLKQAGAS